MRHDELSEFAITVVGSSGICHRALHILCSAVGGLGAVTDGNVSANVVRNYCCRGADRRVKSLIELAERISGFCRVSRPLSPRRHTHTRTHPFNGPLSVTTRVSRYQTGITNLDFY